MNQMQIERSESCLHMTKEELEGRWIWGRETRCKGESGGDIKTKHLSPHGKWSMKMGNEGMIEEQQSNLREGNS